MSLGIIDVCRENPAKRSVEEIAQDILKRKEQVERSFLEIGSLLIEARNQLKKHQGRWLVWLAENVDIPVRKAQILMQLAKEFENASPVSHLGYSKASILLRLREEDRHDFMKSKHDIDGTLKSVDKMSKRELEEAVRKKNSDLGQGTRKGTTQNEKPPISHMLKGNFEPDKDTDMVHVQSCIDGILLYLEQVDGILEENSCMSMQLNKLGKRISKAVRLSGIDDAL